MGLHGTRSYMQAKHPQYKLKKGKEDMRMERGLGRRVGLRAPSVFETVSKCGREREGVGLLRRSVRNVL